MDNANMSQGSDKQNSSDDLIAELARLMASDAKGPTGAEEAAPAAVPEVDQRAEPQITSAEPAPAPAETTPSSPTPNVFAPAPTPVQPSAEPHFGAAETSDPFAPQTPAVPETFTSSKDNLFAPVAPERDSFAEPPVTATPARPEKTVSSETNPIVADAPKAAAPNDGFDLELPPLKPISPDTFADEQSAPAPYTAQRAFETPSEPEVVVQPEPEPEPESPSFAQQSTFAQESSAPFTPEAPVDVAPVELTAPPPAPTAATADEMDPIAALIAEQLKEADRVQPGMARAPMQPSLRHSEPEPAPEPFRRTSSFGVDSEADTPNLSKPARDPLDDIESLIGAALRSEGAQPQATPQPATPQPAPDAFAAPPQQEVPPTAPLDSAAASAEAAILAATDSMRGANLPADSQPFVAPPPQDGQAFGGQAFGGQAHSAQAAVRRVAMPSIKMPTFNLQKVAGPLVAAALLIAVGLGVYWIFGTGGSEDGEAPVLSADTSPIKQAPDATTPDTPSSVVFSENDNAGEPDTIERLISRDETADAAGNDVSRVISTNSNSDSGLANRKVRTVTVRPDGTIVSGGSAVAGGEQLPVDRPNVPAIPGSTVETASNPATTPTPAPTTATNGTIVAPIPLPRPTRRASAPTAPAVTTTPVATAPSASSNSNAVNLIADSARQAVSAPAVTPPASVPITTGINAPAYVQLSSQRNQEAARQSLNRVSSRYAAQLGNNQLEIQQVDLGERGIFYRVRMPAQSLETANSVCANIKASGGDCFVRTN